MKGIPLKALKEEDPYKILAYEIVRQAVKDYRFLYRKQYKDGLTPEEEELFFDTIYFFESNGTAIFTNLNGPKILKTLEQQENKRKKNYIKKMEDELRWKN